MKASLSPFHRLWQRLPAERRRRFFSWVTALATPRVRPIAVTPTRGVIIAGEFSRGSGLGEGARLMVRALRDRNIPCATWDIDLREFAGDPVERNAPLIMHVNAPMLPYVQFFMPRALRTGRRVVGYWAWELQDIPTSWRYARRHVHEIWAPSHFTADAFRTLERPLRVVEHPLGLVDRSPSDRDRASFGLPTECVVVLVSFSLSSSLIRKSPIEAIRAFQQAFGAREDRLLILKIGHATHYPEDLRNILDAVDDVSNIRVETAEFSHPDTLALTRCADIILSLHRSEGFGLVVAEAMALERCVVATDWSATTEFMDTSCGFPVSYTLVPARDPRGIWEMPHTQWALPDIDAAADALRRAADDPDLRKILGERARLRILSLLDGRTLLDGVTALGVTP